MLHNILPVLLVPLLPLQEDSAPRDLTDGFEVADGLRVTLWGESPMLYNPAAIDVDERGRVWVAEAVNYRKWDGRNPGLDHPKGDRIVILEDTDGDGDADKSTVFAQDTDLVAPLGIAVVGSRVFVSSSPNLWVYTDTDGDDVADEREIFLTGFGGYDHDHGLHSVVPGPDGMLYISTGNAGPHIVTDASGWTLRSGSIYRGGGPKTADNKPGLVSDDGKIWTGGLVLRVRPDGTGLEVLSHNFRNNYEVAVDAYGDWFQSDNDDDGNAGCRTLWCLEKGNHGFFSADGSRTWQADRRPGQTNPIAHWHQEDPGVAPMGTINGPGGPTGVTIYEGGLLARWFEGAVFNADAGARVVYAHMPVVNGARIDLEPGDLIRPKAGRSDRAAGWFRPSDVAVLPDGSAIVADWFDPGVGGHAAGDREAYGSLLRIAPVEGANAPRVSFATPETCVAALSNPTTAVRERARAALVEFGDSALPAVRAAAQSKSPRTVARALWVLAELGDHATTLEFVKGSDPRLQVTAIRALARSFGGKLPMEFLTGMQLQKVRAPMVRRELALQLAGRSDEASYSLLIDLAETFGGTDRTLLEAIGIAAEGRESELFTEVEAGFGEPPLGWSPHFAMLAWRLHPPESVPGFTQRALSARLNVDARRQAIDALAFIPTRAAGEAVLTVAQAGPQDLRGHAAWWIKQRAGNDWRGYGLERELESGDFGSAELVYESEVVEHGLIDIRVDISGAEMAWLVVTDGGNGNSCDWADWIEPRFENDTQTWPLTDASWVEAQAQWGNVNKNANCKGNPLQVGKETFDLGLGTHANSRIAYQVPAGATRFVCRAGPDVGGTGQTGGTATSIKFQVRVARPTPTPAVLEWSMVLADASADLGARRDAAKKLAEDPRGALLLIQAQQKSELASDLKEIVAQAIFTNPDLGVRALASEHFSRPGEEVRSFPPVAELLAMPADADRGRMVYQDKERAQCVTCHTYTLGDRTIGGDVGPELTHIGEKLDEAALLDSILNPSAGIVLGYDTWLLETDDGLLHSGFMLADSDTIVLKDTRGERITLEASEVVGRHKQTLSTMPQGVATDMTAQELRDLIAFLREKPTREPVFGEEVVLFDGTSMEGWTHFLRGDAQFEDVWQIEDGVLICGGKPAGYIRTEAQYESFHLSLEWRFDPAKGAGNSGVLMRTTGEDKVWPFSIEAQLWSTNAGDIWNIGNFPMLTDPERTKGRHTTRAQPSSEKPLGEWNRYDIILDGPRMELRVNGVLQNTADWCEVKPGTICLQSEGAEIHFRNIRLRPIVN
jgi:putative membrane-bound dehydrogenase-like protein